MCARVWARPPSAGVRGSAAGSGQRGQKPRAGGLEGYTVPRTLARACLGAQTRDRSAWRDRSWHDRARWERGHRQGGEAGGPSLPRGTWAPGRVVASAGCTGHPDAAVGQLPAFPTLLPGGKGETSSRYQQKGRNHHLNFIVPSSKSHSVPQ